MDYLCKCTNCGTIMYDENPQVDAKKKEVPKRAKHMVQVNDNGDTIWACPICKVDDFLQDL